MQPVQPVAPEAVMNDAAGQRVQLPRPLNAWNFSGLQGAQLDERGSEKEPALQLVQIEAPAAEGW